MRDEATLLERVNVLIHLVALGVCQNKTQREQITILSSAGIKPKEIAEILGTTPNTVSVTLSGSRKQSKSRIASEGE